MQAALDAAAEEEKKMEDLYGTPQLGGYLAGSKEDIMDFNDVKSVLKRDREELEREIEALKNNGDGTDLPKKRLFANDGRYEGIRPVFPSASDHESDNGSL
jgi:hypothetical protein